MEINQAFCKFSVVPRMICEFVSSYEDFFAFAKDPLFLKLFNVVVYSLMTFSELVIIDPNCRESIGM